MKKTIAAAILAGLAATAFAQSQVDASVAFQAPDLNAAPVNKVTGFGDQKSKKAPNLDSNVKFTYTAKLDDANTVKLGAAVDVYTPFYVGTKDYQSQWAAKVIEPFVQYQGFGFDVLTSAAVYTFAPNAKADIAAGKNALAFYTGPLFSATKPAQDNTFPVSNYLKASYKYSFDKTLAVTAGVETDTAVVPVFFLLDVKPQASVTWTFLQVDAKYNLTFKTTDADKSDKTFLYSYLEPKVTVDFKDLQVPGLKAYVGGKFLVATSNGDKLKGSSIQPGASYSFTVKDVGTFGLDTNLKVNGIGPDDVSDNQSYDLSVKASYSVKF